MKRYFLRVRDLNGLQLNELENKLNKVMYNCDLCADKFDDKICIEFGVQCRERNFHLIELIKVKNQDPTTSWCIDAITNKQCFFFRDKKCMGYKMKKVDCQGKYIYLKRKIK